MKNIYENFEIYPSNAVQLVWYEESAQIPWAIWIAPFGEFDAQEVYDQYPAITMHIIIIPEGSSVCNLVHKYFIEANSYASGPINTTKGKTIVKESYSYGIGYSL